MRFKCSNCGSIEKSPLAWGTKVTCSVCNCKIDSPESRFSVGSVIGNFVIQEKLGVGAESSVFRGVSIENNLEVAVKLINADDYGTDWLDAFLNNAATLSKLSHPNLLKVYEAGQEEGNCFLAVEFIKGKSLGDYLAENERLSEGNALQILIAVAKAVNYMWSEHSLIHRDIKPSNIMLGDDGTIKLADLGFAAQSAEIMLSADIIGSPAYMSPEYFAGSGLDNRSDIYSLGITLYELLSGSLPFQGETLQDLAQQHFGKPAIPLHRLGLGIGIEISKLVGKMLEKFPEDRHQTIDELVEAMEALAVSEKESINSQDDIADESYFWVSKSDEQDLNKVSSHLSRLKQRRKKLGVAFILAMPIVLLVWVWIWGARSGKKATKNKELLQNNLHSYIDKLKDYPKLTELEEQVRHVLNLLPVEEELNEQQRAIYWHLQFYMQRIENERLRRRLASQAKATANFKLKKQPGN